jgi:hypothetical protein
VRPPDTLNRALGNKGKLGKIPHASASHSGSCDHRLHLSRNLAGTILFAGFHMPRYAVPFSGIKAKKIPIVQPKLTSGRWKVHKKFLLLKINRLKTDNFLIISAW